jgi:predicted N-formylglutamate amidohydrolase
MRAPEPSPPALLITCEHATHAVPARWAHLFQSPAAQDALRSHRGWDPGAAHLAHILSTPDPGPRTSALGFRPTVPCPLSPVPSPPAPCLLGTASRLLVELNRSPNHPQLWSEFSRDLPASEKDAILRELYAPFRRAAREAINHLAGPDQAPVFHLSVHTFTPELDGEVRTAEIGLLYDPARPLEVRWADAWACALAALAPEWRVRRNYPYLGTDDGHTTHLRTQFSPGAYAGLELEVNQALVFDAPRWPAACNLLRRAILRAQP